MHYPDVVMHIETVLEQLRPTFAAHGGNIEFVAFQDGVVSLRLQGACIGCPASLFTLKLGVEQALKDQIPTISHVITVE